MVDCEHCAALRAEVERLKSVEADYDDHEREMIDLEEDNARLRAEVDNLKSMAIAQEKLLRSKDAENERLTAEVEKLRAALEPFADMGKAMMGRKHPNEAVVQYALAPTIKVFHLVAAHEARDAITQEARDE